MGIGEVSVAAATAVLGYDMAQNTIWQQQGIPRALVGMAVTGSAAAGDAKVDLFIDTFKVGEFVNNATGFPTMDHVFPLGNNYIPPHSQLHIFVTDAPGTNPLNIKVIWKEL